MMVTAYFLCHSSWPVSYRFCLRFILPLPVGQTAPESTTEVAATNICAGVDTFTHASWVSFRCEPSSVYRKRLWINELLNAFVLKIVIAVKAHGTERGLAKRKYHEAETVFITNVFSGDVASVIQSTWNMIYERLKRIRSMNISKTWSQINVHPQQIAETSSGVMEAKDERIHLLEDIDYVIGEVLEERRVARNKRSHLDKDLQAACEVIRACAFGTDDAPQCR